MMASGSVKLSSRGDKLTPRNKLQHLETHSFDTRQYFVCFDTDMEYQKRILAKNLRDLIKKGIEMFREYIQKGMEM